MDWKVSVITRKTYELDSKLLETHQIRQYVIPRPPGSQLTYGLMSLTFPLFFRKVISEVNPDLIHVHSILYAMISAFSEFHPKIITVWGYHHILKSWPLKRLLERRALRSADAITVNSPRLRDKVCEVYEIPRDKVTFLFWGIDLDIFRKGYEEEVEALRRKLDLEWADTIFLSPRAVTPHYNIASIVRAFANLEGERAALIILKGTGKSRHLKEVMELARELGISSKLRFIFKFLTEREMAVLFNLSDAFISIPNTDQIAYTVIEGMACGSIPIISDLPDYDGIIDHGIGGFRVKPLDLGSLSNIMRMVAEDEALRERIASRNSKFVRDFADVKRSLERMRKLYESLLSER